MQCNKLPLVVMSCHDNSHSLTVHLHKCYPVAMYSTNIWYHDIKISNL